MTFKEGFRDFFGKILAHLTGAMLLVSAVEGVFQKPVITELFSGVPFVYWLLTHKAEFLIIVLIFFLLMYQGSFIYRFFKFFTPKSKP
jgi:uncharacterized membrane protein